jgi:FkbH-like protein
LADPEAAWRGLVEIANSRLTYAETRRLERTAKRLFATPAKGADGAPIRLAILASSTVTHLLPSIRVAAMRRGLWLSAYVCDYGQHLQELVDEQSGLHVFRPNAVVLALDPPDLSSRPSLSRAEADAVIADWTEHALLCWRLAREAFKCRIVQQTLLPIAPLLLGNNEHRLPGSPRRLAAEINLRLRALADEHRVDLLALDQRAETDGARAWHDPVLWLRAKYGVNPAAACLYGDLLVRLLAARQGRSAKCLVLDLDNTLWGGVIGDDGLEGILLGNGSALGEAYLAFQHYLLALSKRGVILAVCSKNDEHVAWTAFDKHPEMALRRNDIACLVANWEDKAANLRTIAARINNPFERNFVRRELPIVATPELPEDPVGFASVISDAGYFEGVEVTREDLDRTRLYQSNVAREAALSSTSDLQSYLKGLQMELQWSEFDRIGLGRITQLINKTNQFNVTTRRYSEQQVLEVMRDPEAFGLQFRLTDRFGDNGVIAIVIGRLTDADEATIDTWLMSCRVLGRGVETATLEVVCERAAALGARRLIGEYKRTEKNGMVADHYRKLGFAILSEDERGSRAMLRLEHRPHAPDFMMAVRRLEPERAE